MMAFIKIIRDDIACLQIIPDRSVRNYRTPDLAKAIAELYRSPVDRLFFSKQGIQFQSEDIVTWETIYTNESIAYYLTCPKRLADYFKRKADTVWEKATVKIVDLPASFDITKSVGAELHYKRHDIFSLDTDKRENGALPSLLTAAKSLGEGDRAIVQILFNPVNQLEWELEASRTYDKFVRGAMPRRAQLDKKVIGHGIGVFISTLFKEVFEFISEFVSSNPPSQRKKQEHVFDPEARLLLLRKVEDPSKPSSTVIQTFIRIAAESDEQARAMLTVHSLASAYKDISADNELNRHDIIRYKQRFIEDVNNRRPPIVRINGNIMSIKECGKLMQLPTADLQRDNPAVSSIVRREVLLPDELFIDNIKNIPIGKVTEKGVSRIARIPLEAYGTNKTKHVYDALCTPTFKQGKMGCGKTGSGHSDTYYFVVNGFSAVVVDTADGQILREIEDSLPADFPDEKIIHLELDYKAWPIALNWSDVLGRPLASAEGDAELAALEISEKITARFKEFVAGMASSEFTDRMEQYLSAALKAVTVRKDWSFLDVELAIKSPSFRQELLADPLVKAMPSVVDDLNTLQMKAAAGGDGPIIEPILSRLKVISNSQFMANLFYQQPKLINGKPAIDFRKWIDNESTGKPDFDKYGYLVCIHASDDAWGADGQALILGFIEDKLNFNVFSRCDQDQDKRKPFLSWIDEPHKVIKGVAKYYANANVEFRKYRCKKLYTGHSIEQMGAAANSLLQGGAQLTSYKTESLQDLERFAHAFAPYDDPKDLYDQLPQKWVAVNRVRLASNTECPAFIAEMTPPPKPVKDRGTRRHVCAQQYGRHWKEVSGWITERRRKYQQLDDAWYAAIEDAKQAEKEKERKEKAEQREREKEGKKKQKNPA